MGVMEDDALTLLWESSLNDLYTLFYFQFGLLFYRVIGELRVSG